MSDLIPVESGIGHRLSAAGLAARVDDLVAESLQQLEGRDPDFRIEGVDIARDEKSDAHVLLLSIALRARVDLASEHAIADGGVQWRQMIDSSRVW